MISVFISVGPYTNDRRRLNRVNSSITLRCGLGRDITCSQWPIEGHCRRVPLLIRPCAGALYKQQCLMSAVTATITTGAIMFGDRWKMLWTASLLSVAWTQCTIQ